MHGTGLVAIGGNNDLPIYRPALHVVLADPLRLGDELPYWPGEANLRMADVVVIHENDTGDLAATQALWGDLAIVATPIDLRQLLTIDGPAVRARYELQEIGRPVLADALTPLLVERAHARVPR